MSNQFMNAEEVAGATGMSKSFAFKLIKTLNAELAAQGIMTIPGKVQRSYFEARLLSAPSKQKAAMTNVS